MSNQHLKITIYPFICAANANLPYLKKIFVFFFILQNAYMKEREKPIKIDQVVNFGSDSPIPLVQGKIWIFLFLSN